MAEGTCTRAARLGLCALPWVEGSALAGHNAAVMAFVAGEAIGKCGPMCPV
jgi:hypothetical protein